MTIYMYIRAYMFFQTVSFSFWFVVHKHCVVLYMVVWHVLMVFDSFLFVDVKSTCLSTLFLCPSRDWWG
jgi:hypothetical protein